MIHFHGDGILLDIEGTTSSLRFVHDVLFPYARQNAGEFLKFHWQEGPVQHGLRAQLMRDAEMAHDWPGTQTLADAQRQVMEAVYRLMDADSKTTGLKQLQGMIWDAGYREGRFQSHVFPDVPEALKKWRERGLDVRIFSSGSVAAQLAFFRHTEAGDLLPFFRGHYDTTIGPKREPDSYRRISQDMKLPPERILFLSDIIAELDAARAAGLHTGLAVRPGNAPVAELSGHERITSFAEIHAAGRGTPNPAAHTLSTLIPLSRGAWGGTP